MNSEAWHNAEVTGHYYTSHMYRELKGPNPTIPWRNLMRKNQTRPRAIFVMWMTCHSRLNTKDRLARFGTITDEACLFCGDIETCSNLFFACRETHILWKQVLHWIHIDHGPQAWENELKWIIGRSKGKSRIAKLLKICMAEVIYYVWNARNKKAFQGIDSALNIQDIKEIVCTMAQSDRQLRGFCNEL
ncbi:uncharacterized protein LOC131622718 [Vicia villosa]|uniref:uncharacterized protein LOC131622718 n=1 Tax=Vicia villosa TaxID=3911 RepID=UPI00273B245B|nr:uncharacterized protein LOC131622718 [Vicia villosa]